MQQLTVFDLMRLAEIAARPDPPTIPVGTPAWYANPVTGRTEVVGYEWAGDVFSWSTGWYTLLRFPGDHAYACRCHPGTEGDMWGFYSTPVGGGHTLPEVAARVLAAYGGRPGGMRKVG